MDQMKNFCKSISMERLHRVGRSLYSIFQRLSFIVKINGTGDTVIGGLPLKVLLLQ